MEELALSLLRLGHLDSAWRAAENGIAVTGEDRCKSAFWQFRFIRASVMVIRGRTEEGLSYLDSLGDPCDEDTSTRASLLMYKGYWLGMAGKYDSSCALLAEAQSLATKATLFALQGEIKVRQAMVCYLQGQFEASRTLYKSVVDTQGDSCGPYLHAIAIGGVGKSLMAQGMFEQALEWLYKASEVAREGGFTLLSASHASEIGVCHTGLGNIEKALEVHREAGNALYEIGAMQHYQVNLADIGNVYVHKGDFLTAISYYRRALAIAEQINHPASIEKWNYNIRLAYIKLRESIDQIRPSLTTPLPPL